MNRPVAVVTGGGGGIGAAVAEALGRGGWHVVTVDPLVTLDGAATLPEPQETTAARIVAAGGSAEASPASVTDADALRELFAGLPRLDAVVNVAGITRPTGFAKGTEDDWRSVLEVHLDGYRNVLEAALPRMADAGSGRIVGVTSGSGWRAADAGAYSCAKRAVAALTWQLGEVAPRGVVVTAMSPIAVTRMVTAALARQPSSPAAGAKATGGLSLGSMPQPEELGPLGAHLAGGTAGWSSGHVVFAGGAEVALVEPPRLLEVLRTDGLAPGALPAAVAAFATEALAKAEAAQVAGGGSNPRYPSLGAEGAATRPPASTTTCAVATDRPELAGVLAAALGALGVRCVDVPLGGAPATFAGAADALAAVGPVDAVVVAFRGAPPSTEGDGWRRVLEEHHGIVGGIHADAAWARAVADAAAGDPRPLRVVTLTDAATAGGRSRAQAAAQLARAAVGATEGRVAAFAVAVEAPHDGDLAAVGELAAHLVAADGADALAGAELVAGDGWLGLRSHPRPAASVVLTGPEIPPWFDAVLGEAAR